MLERLSFAMNGDGLYIRINDDNVREISKEEGFRMFTGGYGIQWIQRFGRSRYL